MAGKSFDVVVIGGGVNGSAAAYSLIKRGKKVLLLDQFPVGHTRGSSHGHSRTFRISYKKKVYAQMSQDSIALWRKLEAETNETLFIQKGMCQLFPSDSKDILECKGVLNQLGVNYSVMSNLELNRTYPAMKIPDGYTGIVDHEAGVLVANKCVLAFQKVFRELGGVMQDVEQVIDISPGETIEIKTTKGSYKCASAIIVAGPWTNKLASFTGIQFPLRRLGMAIHYWKIEKPEHSSAFNMPIIQYKEPCEVYVMPTYEYPGMVKLSNTGGSDIDPEHRDDIPEFENCRDFGQKFMKGVSPSPSISEKCISTMTPDKDFIMDLHPNHSNIVFGVYSCHGFKMSPINGVILADLALSEKPAYDLESMKILRFKDVFLQ